MRLPGRLRTLTIATVLALSAPAYSADFSMTTGLDGRPAIRIANQIEPNDHVKFQAFARTHPQAYSLILSGPGGALWPATRIGIFAHTLGLETVIPAHSDCASACAFIWVAGKHRVLEDGARVGFHGAFKVEDGAIRISREADTFVGSYLARLDYQDNAIAYMTKAAPSQMTWMGSADSIVGIPFDNKSEPVTINATGSIDPALTMPLALAGARPPAAALAAANTAVKNMPYQPLVQRSGRVFCTIGTVDYREPRFCPPYPGE